LYNQSFNKMNPVNTKPYHLPADAVWLITGCSSGIGREIATLVASKSSQRVIATARNPSSLSYLPDNSNILKLALDVTSTTSVDNAFKAAAARFGSRIDVVVNNAGYSLSGDTEAATEEDTHEEMETLFFGTARITMHSVKIMRENHRGGLIFNVSSLGGVCAFPGHAYYHAGKFAVTGWTESVAREMHPDWNIHFCILEPGGIKTNFETSSKKHIKPHEAYAAGDMPARQLESYVEQALKSNPGFALEPSALAKVVFEVASRKQKVPLFLPFGAAAVHMMKSKLEERLQGLEDVKELSLMT